jgi:hypothetical protein
VREVGLSAVHLFTRVMEWSGLLRKCRLMQGMCNPGPAAQVAPMGFLSLYLELEAEPSCWPRSSWPNRRAASSGWIRLDVQPRPCSKSWIADPTLPGCAWCSHARSRRLVGRR